MTADELTGTLERLREARRELARRPHKEIVAALERVVEAWLEPESRWRREAEALLPACTGFSPEMIRAALPTMIEPLRAPALRELLAKEVGRTDEIEARLERGAPRLIVHVGAGNLAGGAAIPVVLSLALRAAALIKPASVDRVFPGLFRRSLAACDPLLGQCVAVHYWPGGAREIEERAFRAADLVIASGSDATIEDLRARCPARFLGFGHRISFAIVTGEIAADRSASRAAAADLAHDVSLWDQRGCLSPQICLVEGGHDTAGAFGEMLADELAAQARMLPPGRLALDERLELRRFRDEAEVRQLGDPACRLLASAGNLDWTVVVEPPAFLATPLHRSVRVQALPDLGRLDSLLAPHRNWLEACGLAAPPARYDALASRIASSGVHRVCPLGHMQHPPLDWRQGGVARLGAWLRS